jgi:uncharacterized Zn finger protein
MPWRLPSELHAFVGKCPLCNTIGPPFEHMGGVLRRSNRSVTMRCSRCGLQWTMTWLKIHQAAVRGIELVRGRAEQRMLRSLADMTAFAVEQETRGRRAST